MAAEVSSLNRNPNSLITQDLLAGLSRPDNPLDFMSRKTYLRGSVSPMSSSSFSSSGDLPAPELQDLNYPPTKASLVGETSSWSLELKLDSPCTRSNYASVCTLDKVKSALQRAEQGRTIKKRPSLHQPQENKEPKTTSSCGMFASACPGCFLYVIAEKSNPKCPRCNAVVSCPPPPKKPRIDLNSMQQWSDEESVNSVFIYQEETIPGHDGPLRF